jgi:SLT domain-containing protein
MLDALRISDRASQAGAQLFADMCIAAHNEANDKNTAMCVGWQINDASGDREPGYGPMAALSLLTLEPVAMLYPLQRNPIKCKR